MEVEGGELVSGTEVAKRLGLSRERIRQLQVRGEMPPPVGRLGRAVVWLWADVELWARDNGRFPPAGPGQQERRVTGRDASKVCVMKLTVEELFGYPCGAQRCSCHLRIWEADGQTPLVLVGNLDDGGGNITNAAATLAGLISARKLGGRTDFDYVEHLPPGGTEPDAIGSYRTVSFAQRGRRSFVQRILATGSDGQIGETGRVQPRSPFARAGLGPASQQELEQRTGQRIVEFPAGTYTKANVGAFLENHGRQITVGWDPWHLQRDARHVARLDEELRARQARLDQAGAPQQPARVLFEHTISAIGYAASILAMPARSKQAGYEREDASQDPDSPVRKQYPQLPTQTWELLDRCARDPDFQAPAQGEDAAQAGRWQLRAVRDLIAEYEVAGDLDTADLATLDALRAAEAELTFHVHNADPAFRAGDHPDTAASLPLDVRGDADRAYLSTVAWWGPAPGDEQRAGRLERDFLDQHRPLRSGYDPFGRMVVRSCEGNDFAVEYPLRLPSLAYPDEACIVGAQGSGSGGRPVYVRLPDGRMDLLPHDPDDPATPPSFAWGYRGGGPARLHAAILRACCQDYRNPAVQRGYRDYGAFNDWLDSQIEAAAQDRLELPVGEIRRRFRPPEDANSTLNL